MAPELAGDRPYNYSVDLWSFGVLLYELVTGEPPFYSEKVKGLMELIQFTKVKYPQEISPDLKSLIQGLLKNDFKKRIGWSQILVHPFLKKDTEFW